MTRGLVIESTKVPLRVDDRGAVRVGDTRVTLDTVVHAFLAGASPETIADQYDSLSSGDVFTHRARVDEYLAHRERQAGGGAEGNRAAGGLGAVPAAPPRPSGRPLRIPMIRLLADEKFNGHIVRGLLRQMPEADVVRAQDVGLTGRDDPDLLEWAARERRVVLSHDAATLIGFAYDRVRAGRQMPGVIIVRRGATVGGAIGELILALVRSDEPDWDGQVRHVPL